MVCKISEQLEIEGLSVSVISCHTIKPLDVSGVVDVLGAHSKVVVIEEHVPQGSLGAQIKNIAWDIQARCRLITISLKDEFIHCYGTHDELLNAHGMSAEKILFKIKQ